MKYGNLLYDTQITFINSGRANKNIKGDSNIPLYFLYQY